MDSLCFTPKTEVVAHFSPQYPSDAYGKGPPCCACDFLFGFSFGLLISLTPPLTGSMASWDVSVWIMLIRLLSARLPAWDTVFSKSCWANGQSHFPLSPWRVWRKAQATLVNSVKDIFTWLRKKRLGQKAHLVYLKIPLSYHCKRVWNWQTHRCQRCFGSVVGCRLKVFRISRVLKLPNTWFKNVNLMLIMHYIWFPSLTLC